jgi:hypothetical protein
MHEIKHIGLAEAPFGTPAIRLLPAAKAGRKAWGSRQANAAASGRQQRAYLLSRGNT